MVWNCIGITQYLGVIPAKAGIQKFQKTTGSPIEPFGDDELDMKCRFVIDMASLKEGYNMKRMVHMARNVLVVSASPRKGGNSDLLCDQFLLGAKEAGNQVKKIFLRDKKINHCLACGACQSNGGRCVQKDDMAEVLGKMIAADVMVMATPVYFYNMNGQMKTLIDRTYSRYTEISNKEMYFIVAAATGSKQALERTVEGFRGFTSCLNGAKEKGIIYGTGAWRMGDIKGSKAMTEAYEMGKNI